MVDFRSFDLFALPFQFAMIGNAREKKTLFGGIISLVVILLSIAYFAYLCSLYFGNKMSPSITNTNQYLSESYSISFSPNMVAFKVILQNGMLLQDFETQQGKTYLSYLLYVSTGDSSGNPTYQYLSPMLCDDPDLSGYFCVDFSPINPDSLNIPTLTYYPEDVEKQKLEFILLYCDTELISPGQLCASPTEIRQNVIRYDTKIYVRLTFQQYNTKTKSYEKKVRQEQFYFAESLVFIGKFSLIKQTTTISSGFLFQQEEKDTFISNYLKYDQYTTNTFIQQETQLNVLGAVYIFLNENQLLEYIQFPQFTSLLAQFSSVFNTFLVIGFISRMIAQSEIIQEFVELKLKLYYKQSALEIMRRVEKQSDQSTPNRKNYIDFIHLYKSIQNMDYKKYISEYMSVSFFKRIKLFFFSDGQDKADSKDTKEVLFYKKLMNSTAQSMNIFDIQKELLRIKMMLSLIVTVEQYAAMQFCGSKIQMEEETIEQVNAIDVFKAKDNDNDIQPKQNEIQQSQDQIKNNINVKLMDYDINQSKISQNQFETPQIQQMFQKDIELVQQSSDKQTASSSLTILNHLEQIDQLERNSSYLENCLDRFLNKNNVKSDLDERIFNCMIGIENQEKDQEQQQKQILTTNKPK